MPPSPDDQTMSYVVRERTRTPASSLVLAYGPMLPFVAGAAWIWAGAPEAARVVELLSLWGGALVAFLAGVRRGLTFRSPDGETWPQLATMFFLFVVAVAALLATPSPSALILLAIGFASVGVLDWRAARREEAPPFFARLRPVQMAIPTLCLLALLPKA